MTINQRIEKLIKELNITQTAFAQSLGVTQAYISKVTHTGNPSDLFINNVCMIYSISEEWLRTGKGDMYILENSDPTYSKNIVKLRDTDDETVRKWINAIADSNPDTLRKAEEFMKKFLNVEQ